MGNLGAFSSTKGSLTAKSSYTSRSVLSSRLTGPPSDDSLEDGEEGVRISSANVSSSSIENEEKGERGDEGDEAEETTV